jgi:organic hydroperoxide reductase OsmC/OhrA
VSQVAAKRRLTLRNESVRVVAHFEEEGSVLAGTQQGSCKGFSIELSLEGDDNAEDMVKLIRMAHRMCFTESALTQAIEVKTSHLFNGEPIDIGMAES